jgi:hypothetical protein
MTTQSTTRLLPFAFGLKWKHLLVAMILYFGGSYYALQAQSFSENFDDITLLPGEGWALVNASSPVGSTDWFQGNNTVFNAYNGATTAYIGANFNNAAGTGTISNWLMSPVRTFNNGDVISFYTRTNVNPSSFPDRLRLMLSTNGNSTATASFTTTLLSVNAGLTTSGYPSVWTQYTATLSGLPGGGVSGRFALWYDVTNAGPSGSNSDYIGIDNVVYTASPPTCPSFSGAPANVSIVNSTCSSNVVSGGSITAPAGTPCPAGSTLQYNVNNTGWTSTLPDYNQTGPVQSIVTRCSCDSDANNVSAESTAVTTVPGSCSPANDLCANAAPISCGTTISSSNINATAEPGNFAPCGVVQTTAGVWYTFTGDGSTVTLSTCSAASFDTKISVYTDGCATPTCVTGNDDACPSGRSTVTFIAANGTVYLVLIHGFGGATGTFDLTLSCAPTCPTFSGAPANVSIVNSSCGSGCTLTGGSITAPTGMPCPAGSTLQYNVDNSGWTTTLPDYNQSGPAQSIRTRCSCDNDANNVSAESNPVSTMPGTLANPVVPANGAATVTCPASATQPTPPVITACDGSAITPTGPAVTNDPSSLTCEGTRTYTWTYSCGTTSSTWSFVYTIERNPFTVPANGAATVACLAAITVPVPPAVNSNCGEPIAPAFVSIVDGPTPLTCEGTRTYNYSYTDCEGNTLPWSFVYTIERNPFTVPANGAATVNSPTSATQPTPPTVTSNCGETLTPTGPVVTNSPNPIVCTGTRTYAWTYTDCEGNTAIWSFVYTIIDNTPPMVNCSNSTVTFNGQESITLNANTFVTATDNCGIQSITLNPSVITCQQVGQQVPVTATVTDINGNTATCTSTITVGGLPCGWSQNPDGVNCAGGNSISFNAASGVYTATSTNCYYASPFTADETAFAQRTLCGNGSITALVTGISGSALGWAGVVMRESNAAGAKKAQLMTNLSNLSRREFRTSTNGASQPQQFPSQDRYWLRITRVGNQFTMLISANGISWFPAGVQNIVMNNCIQMGLAATNYTANSTVTATFANVSFTGSNGTLALPGGGVTELAAHSSQLEADFNVYPNPTGGELNVDLTQYIGRSVRLEVYSLEGKLMQFTELDEVQNTLERLDLKGLQNGMYLVKVKSAGLPDATRRVVLTRG